MDTLTKKDIQEIFDSSFEKTRKILQEDMINIFNQGFEEIVRPELEEIKTDIKEIKQKLVAIESRLDSLERKVDTFSARVMDLESRFKDHEQKVHQLKTA